MDNSSVISDVVTVKSARMSGRLAPICAEQLSGTVASITFHNAENGYCILRVSATGYKKQVTIIGTYSSVSDGAYIEASGRWVTHPKHGEQFMAEELRLHEPRTVNGLVRFLGSGVVKGIGKSLARKLGDTFGERLPEIIVNNPSLLESVSGVGRARRQQIVAAWEGARKQYELLAFLYSNNIAGATASKLLKVYGEHAGEVVRRNPYRLCTDVDGIGFKTADGIAVNLHIPSDSLMRIRAGIIEAVKRMSAHGDCMMYRDVLIDNSIQVLSGSNRAIDLKAIDVARGLKACLGDGDLVEEDVNGVLCYYLPGVYRAEKFVAEEINRIRLGNLPWPDFNHEAAVEWVQKKSGILLSPSQRLAVTAALVHKLSILTGGPGSGKTTILKCILMILRAKGTRILLAAPTGRAARRLSDATGMEATTVHRLLGYNGRTQRYSFNKDNRLPADLVVIDESSMLGLRLTRSLLQTLPDSCGLLLSGDDDQIGSIDQGAVLFDLIDSDAVSVSRLRETHRQGEGSDIITCAQMINQGLAPETSRVGSKNEFQIIEADTSEEIEKHIIELVRDTLPRDYGFDPHRDVQVLTPIHRGMLGTISLNQKLQQVLARPGANTLRRRNSNMEYREGDKVVQTKNNHDREVYNGDIGLITQIDHENKQVNVEFDGRLIRYAFAEMDELALGAALSCHKSQGSEWPAVVIPLTMEHYVLMDRRLLYTAVTRAKSRVVLVGQRRALMAAIANVRSSARVTGLARRIKANATTISTAMRFDREINGDSGETA